MKIRSGVIISLVCVLPLLGQQSAQSSGLGPYPHAKEPIGTVREIYDGVLTPEMAVNTFRNIDRLFPTSTIRRSSTPVPLPPAATPLKTIKFSDSGKTYDLEEYPRPEQGCRPPGNQGRPRALGAVQIRKLRTDSVDVDVGRQVDHLDTVRGCREARIYRRCFRPRHPVRSLTGWQHV